MISEEGKEDDELLEEAFDGRNKLQTAMITQGWIKYISVAVLIFLIALLFFLQKKGQNADVKNGTLLGMGVEVWLHESAAVKVVDSTHSDLEIDLIGKAYFKLKQKNRQLKIRTSQALVDVTDLSEVMVIADASKTELFVIGGGAKLMKDSLSVSLQKDEQVVASKTNRGIIKKEFIDPNLVAWKTNVLIFNKTPVSEVINVLEELYNISIKLENAQIKDCQLTLELRNKTLEEAVSMIADELNMNYQLGEVRVFLEGNGC